MLIRDLTLIHRYKREPADSLRLRAAHDFYLDTCQRDLWLGLSGIGTAQLPVDGECLLVFRLNWWVWRLRVK